MTPAFLTQSGVEYANSLDIYTDNLVYKLWLNYEVFNKYEEINVNLLKNSEI